MTPFPCARIAKRVADSTGVPVHDMRSGRLRPPEVIEARHLAFWAVRRLTNKTTPQIGSYFNRHHASVLQAIRKIERKRDGDDEYRGKTDVLLAGCRIAMEAT